jgi:hypothetical protein
MLVFGLIALAGFIAFWFTPQLAAPLFLPALGAYLGARKAESTGPSQPAKILWIGFFILAAIAGVIRFFLPEDFLNSAETTAVILLWIYLGVLAVAFVLFGYLAYLQRVGRNSNN